MDEASRLKAIRPSVRLAYLNYMVDIWDLSGIKPVGFDAEDSALLKTNYDKLHTDALFYIRKMILGRSRFCVYCGYVRPSELDHYLPRSRFPEFSVLSLNLLPACHRCNNRKRTTFGYKSGLPVYLHAYLHQLPVTERYLTAKVEVTTGAVNIFYSVIETWDMLDGIFPALRSQFEKLDLALLFAEEATLELQGTKELLQEEYQLQGGPSAVRAYLKRYAKSRRRILGTNHWLPILYDALAESDDFCDRGFDQIDDLDTLD